MFSSSEAEFTSENIDKLIYDVKDIILKRKMSYLMANNGSDTDIQAINSELKRLASLKPKL
jgi:hypothetical protein